MAALAATPAAAAHCPLGQIWRVHLDECVGAGSALARAYVRPVRAPHAVRRRLADADPPPEPPPPPSPAPPAAESEPVYAGPLTLPALGDGAPDIWRFCQAAPKLCKASER